MGTTTCKHLTTLTSAIAAMKSSTSGEVQSHATQPLKTPAKKTPTKKVKEPTSSTELSGDDQLAFEAMKKEIKGIVKRAPFRRWLAKWSKQESLSSMGISVMAKNGLESLSGDYQQLMENHSVVPKNNKTV